MLSVIVITYNEEDNIARCLESVKWADEIVVVDDFSEDKTVEICHRYTDKIFQRTWNGYGEQKNFAIEKCQGDWVLSIDADEAVTPQLKEEILKVTNRDPARRENGFYIPFRLYFLGKFLRFGGCRREEHLRLFRRDRGKFNINVIHEKLLVKGDIGQLAFPINHYSYDSLKEYFSKLNHYTSLAAFSLKGNGKKFRFWHLALPLLVFVKKYFLQLGFFDGWAGLVWAGLSSLYVFVKYLKLWELDVS